MNTTNLAVSVSAVALSDHLSRLYPTTIQADDVQEHFHVDLDGAVIVTPACWPKTRVTAIFTRPALADLRADAEYQNEFSESRQERAMWHRLLAALP